jgi:hypothetical protein
MAVVSGPADPTHTGTSNTSGATPTIAEPQWASAQANSILTITFGIFASIVGLLALLVGFLQLREKLRRRRGKLASRRNLPPLPLHCDRRKAAAATPRRDLWLDDVPLRHFNPPQLELSYIQTFQINFKP